MLIRRVEDSDGNVLFNEPGKADRAVSEATAFLMASMLADVINAGTAYRARQSGFMLPAAGKTGTTNDYVDAWFVGFTPQAGHRRVDRVRSAEDDHPQRLCGRDRGAAVGRLHEGGDHAATSRTGSTEAGVGDRPRTSAASPASCRTAAATTSRWSIATARSRRGR